MKSSFIFGFILLILLIIGIFVSLPYATQIVKSGSFPLPFTLPFSFPKITAPLSSDYFFKPMSKTGAPALPIGRQALPIGRQVSSPAVKPGESLYKGKINIGSVYFSGGGQISLKSSYFSKEKVIITGWKIKSAKKGETIIGKAINIPQFDFALSDIWLAGGDSIDIVIGPSPLGNHFRVNNCFGWLSSVYNLDYSVNYCSDGFNFNDLTGLDSACQDLILGSGSCRAPSEDILNKNLYQQCRQWVEKNMNYNACVSRHINDSGFYKGWKIYTGNNNPIFDPRHDRIEFRDQNGFLVDSYEY